MGSKHKEAQSARREARTAFKNHRKELHDRLRQLNEILKQKPKWCPQKVWAWCSNIFIDAEKFKKYFT